MTGEGSLVPSRRAPDFETRAEHVAVDLSNPDDAKRAFADLKDVTHVFSTALRGQPARRWILARSRGLPNITIQVKKTPLTRFEPVAKGLEHVCLLQGTKVVRFQHLGLSKKSGPHRTTPAPIIAA